MTRVLKKFVCALFLVSLLAGTSLAENLDFTLVNRSGFTMTNVFVCPSGVTNWKRNQEVRGKFPVFTNEKVAVAIENPGYQNWDMLIVFEDGREWELHNVDLSAAKSIIINVDGRALDETGKYHDFPEHKVIRRTHKKRK